MKLVAKPIDVLAVFIIRDKPRPYRMRFKGETGEDIVIRIEKVISIEERSVPGVKTFIYECQSTKGADPYRYQLLYKPDSSTWLLYKI